MFFLAGVFDLAVVHLHRHRRECFVWLHGGVAKHQLCFCGAELVTLMVSIILSHEYRCLESHVACG